MEDDEDMQNFVCCGKKILGVAINYLDALNGPKEKAPEKPLIFMKPVSTYIEEGENIHLPKALKNINYQIELGVVIGKTCKEVSKDYAMNFVAGYCLALDLSAMDELKKAKEMGHPWTVGKSFDTATPVSKFIPKSKVNDPHNLPLWLKVNKKMKQEGNTKDLLFKIPELIERISKFMTLEPRDVILTGTPGGAARLKPGDVLECGLGDLVTLNFDVKGIIAPKKKGNKKK